MFKRTVFLLPIAILLMVGTVTAVPVALSRDGLSPTPFVLSAATTLISDTLSGFPDVAYYTVTVPDDHQLDAITLQADAGSDGGYWFAIMEGAQFTENSTNSSAIVQANLLGHVVVGRNYYAIGDDVLADMGNASGAIGFTGALPAGTYAFRIQNWGSGGTFALDYAISEAMAVPTAVSLSQVTSSYSISLFLLWFLLFIFTSSYALSADA